MRPVLDTMQVLPAFVYLIPALVLFGVSGTQGIFLTVVYSIPPVIRLTNLGIRQVPLAVIETAHSHGSTTWQTLLQVQLPLAKSSIMMGVNQTIMMAVSMIIVTALVGVDGLGRDVWLSLREVDAGEGLESGIAIVLLAIVLDRYSFAMSRSSLGSAGRPGLGHEPQRGRRATRCGTSWGVIRSRWGRPCCLACCWWQAHWRHRCGTFRTGGRSRWQGR